MKIILIYCGVGVAGFNSNRIIGDLEGGWIAHGICSIGTVLSENYSVSLIDMRKLSGFEEFESVLKKADVYGISVSAVDYIPALKTAIIIKKKYPDSKTVIGGIHPTLFFEKYNNQYIDTVIIGEGEITFPKIIKEWKFPKVIKGEQPDLNKLPFINREFFDYRYELGCRFVPNQKLPSATILAGRGCAYNCTYCQPAENAVFGVPFRMRSVDNVIEEIERLKSSYNIRSLIFWDDTFTIDKQWIIEFIKQYKFDMPVIACSRADIINRNEDMIKDLSKIVKWFIIGFESGSQRLLDFIKKRTTVEDNIKAGEICRKYGIKIFGTYMYGLPTETKEESKMTYDMIEKINPEHKSPFYFLPIEGTYIYKFCEENDLILSNVKQRTIARTKTFIPSLKGINYNYINSLVFGE